MRPFLGVVMVTTCDPLSCGGVPGVCSKGLARVRERVKGRVRGLLVCECDLVLFGEDSGERYLSP